MNGVMTEVCAGESAGEVLVAIGSVRRTDASLLEVAANDPNANVPVVVIGLWLVAALGFVAYFTSVYAPHLLASLR